MRIILADAGLGPLADWVGALACDYASRFVERGHEVLIVSRAGRRPAEGAPSSFRVWSYPASASQSVCVASFSASAACAVLMWRPDAVLAFGPMPEGVFFHALSRVLPCRYATMVLSAGALREPAGRKLAGGLDAVFGSSQFVIAASGFTRDALAMLGVPRDRIGVIHPGAAISGTDPAVPSPCAARHGSFVMGSEGPLVGRGGHDIAIRAMPRILDEFPRAEYRILGGGPQERGLEALAASLHVRQATRFLGRYSRHVGETFRNGLDVLVAGPGDDGSTTGAEGLLGILDAAAAGVPCVGARSGAVPELVIHGETGLIVEPGSPDALAESVCRLARDTPLCRRMGEAARVLAASRFGRTAQIDTVLDWLVSLGPRQRRRPTIRRPI